jgi:hypothetical protein
VLRRPLCPAIVSLVTSSSPSTPHSTCSLVSDERCRAVVVKVSVVNLRSTLSRLPRGVLDPIVPFVLSRIDHGSSGGIPRSRGPYVPDERSRRPRLWDAIGKSEKDELRCFEGFLFASPGSSNPAGRYPAGAFSASASAVASSQPCPRPTAAP